jgi:response regulator RpfG family c-di-GMP phosphodiesterase
MSTAQEASLPRILCVDDEPNVLAAIERNLFGEFDVITATNAEAAVDIVRWRGPFAVIMSDMRMPGMDGAAFLAQARELAPQSVRILLTGQADIESSIAAVNQGAIFRYLCKPCPKEILLATLGEAVAQNRLIRAEKELLETTLAAAVGTLTEVLSMVAPWAFQRATFAQACVAQAVAKLDWDDPWIYTLAASLSQIGCVGIPPDIIQAQASNQPLSPEDEKLLVDHPEVASRLVSRIPRLERVAQIIRYQQSEAPIEAGSEVQRGVQLLRAALALEQLLRQQVAPQYIGDHLAALRPRIPEYVIKAVVGFRTDASVERSVRVRELLPGWTVVEDIRTSNGLMVLTAGHTLTETAIAALQRLLAVRAIGEPIRVRCQAA